MIAKWVFVICLPALFISSGIAWGFNSLWLYEYGFEKYGVSQTTGLPDSELEKSARALINYFNSDGEYIQITVTNNKGNTFELFTQDEKIHFKDVRDLIWLDYRVLFISLGFVLLYSLFSVFWKRKRNRQQLARAVIQGSGLTAALIIILGAASILDFDRLFLQFHYLAFTNTLWSAQGYMLLLFPGGFWFDAALICIAFIICLAAAAGILALIYRRLSQVKGQ
jgi:integral membrane protein (TIGR01906 family)